MVDKVLFHLLGNITRNEVYIYTDNTIDLYIVRNV